MIKRVEWMLAVGGFVTVLAIGYFRMASSQPNARTATAQQGAGTARTFNASRSESASHATAVTQSAKKATPGQPADLIGTASGAVHFQKSVHGAADNADRIDLAVHAALGIWQPSRHRMRILLLENAPNASQVDTLLAFVRSPDGGAEFGGPRGIIDLNFQPAAQAFDRNELDSAALTADNDAGLVSTADVLGSLQWTGSVPSPQMGSGARSRIELTASGDAVSTAQETWTQSWRLQVSVLVAMVD
jgi:hypothetical protein